MKSELTLKVSQISNLIFNLKSIQYHSSPDNELQAQKVSLEANASNHKIDLDCIKVDFLQYLYSPDILPELIHRFISRIEIEKDGTSNIFYNFQRPTIN